MKFLTGCLVVLMVMAASGADAWSWPWKRAKKTPQPLDSPIVRPKNKNLGKPKSSDHRAEFDKAGWGVEKRNTNVKNPREGNHSIFVD